MFQIIKYVHRKMFQSENIYLLTKEKNGPGPGDNTSQSNLTAAYSIQKKYW